MKIKGTDMLKRLAVLIPLLTPTFAVAEDYREICDEYGQTAEAIMISRQSDVGLSKILKIMQQDNTLENIVFKAYDTPRFRTAENQTEAVEDFRDKVHLSCITIMKKASVKS